MVIQVYTEPASQTVLDTNKIHNGLDKGNMAADGYILSL
jgi:hypothetical protein